MNKYSKGLTFSDIITRKSYIIPTNLSKVWTLYKNRYALAGAMGALLWSFNFDYRLAVLISAAFAIVSEIMFRIKFLPQCKITKPDSPRKDLNTKLKVINTMLWALTSIGLFIQLNNTNHITLSGAIYLVGGVVSGATSLIYLISIFYPDKI